MLSRGFKIVSPKTFEIDIESVEINKDEAIVQIDYAAICKADLRYYLGNRDKKILGLKYPMRLIHEATGIVLKDISGKFNVGDKVVLVPNICDCQKCDFIYKNDNSLGVNYCNKAKFASSNYDGFSSEYISYPISNLVKYNNEVLEDKIAVFSELISVCISAIRRINLGNNIKIGIWGDGVVGYILANVLKNLNNNNKIIVIGVNESKLQKFDVDEVYLAKDINNNLDLDIAFECVGGKFAASAINQIIELVKFGADIVLTGVSECGAEINTRRILEKGVSITGSTRSTVADFEKAITLLENTKLMKQIEKLILSINMVEGISDYYKAFEKEAYNDNLGKHIIKFKL